MGCGLRSRVFGQLFQPKPSNQLSNNRPRQRIGPRTSADHLSQFTIRIRKQEQPIAFPDTEEV